jgi:hypothetical protein
MIMQQSDGIISAPNIQLKRFRFVQHVEDSIAQDQATKLIHSSQSYPVEQRLSTWDRRRLNELLWPIVKYYPDPPWPEPWSLYVFPMSFRRERPSKELLDFLAALIDSASAGKSVHSYTFFEQQRLYPNLIEVFTPRAMSFMSILGIGVRPEHGPPRLPGQRDMEGLNQEKVKTIAEKKGQEMTLQNFFPDLPTGAYWIKQNHTLARELLTGEGGWSFILSPIGETTFFEKTKAILLEGSRDEALKLMPLIIPLLGMSSFHRESIGKLYQWFEALDLYLGESLQDRGLVIASRTCLDDLLIRFVRQFKLEREGTFSRR